MSFFLVKRASCVQGEVRLLGDKSIACRSIIISAISCGKTIIENFPPNKDSLYGVKTFQKLGIKIIQKKNAKIITVFGKGLHGLKQPKSPIFVGDSGTIFRLTLGVLAGQNFRVILTAGKSLSRRPMLRVTAPLRMMDAVIKSKVPARGGSAFGGKSHNSKVEEYPPITIKGGRLKPIGYKMPVASAQVKSAILLAGLYAKGKTRVIEPVKTRDHTERMLRLFKADIKVNPSTALRVDGERSRTIKQNTILIKGDKELVSPGRIFIPGDISSASFFMVLGAILPNSSILIRNVNLNPSRIGIINALKRMGADIKVKSQKSKVKSYEPMGNLIVKSSVLNGTVVKKAEIPSLIDELPILMVAACFARGKSVFEGVSELRVKETDRIKSMSENLTKMGADIRIISATSRGGSAKFATKNGESAKYFGGNFGGKTSKSEKIIIQGKRTLTGTRVRSFGDHRTAMSMVVAGLAAQGQTQIDDVTCINKSFPNFLSLIKDIS